MKQCAQRKRQDICSLTTSPILLLMLAFFGLVFLTTDLGRTFLKRALGSSAWSEAASCAGVGNQVPILDYVSANRSATVRKQLAPLVVHIVDADVQHNNFGNNLLQRGQLDKAIMQYQTALAINPDLAEIHYNLGNAFLKKGQVDQALQHLQKSIQISPNFADAHNSLGILFLEKGRVEDAITEFKTAITLKPDNYEAQSNLTRAEDPISPH